jgi:hypothetical protein
MHHKVGKVKIIKRIFQRYLGNFADILDHELSIEPEIEGELLRSRSKPLILQCYFEVLCERNIFVKGYNEVILADKLVEQNKRGVAQGRVSLEETSLGKGA